MMDGEEGIPEHLSKLNFRKSFHFSKTCFFDLLFQSTWDPPSCFLWGSCCSLSGFLFLVTSLVVYFRRLMSYHCQLIFNITLIYFASLLYLLAHFHYKFLENQIRNSAIIFFWNSLTVNRTHILGEYSGQS